MRDTNERFGRGYLLIISTPPIYFSTRAALHHTHAMPFRLFYLYNTALMITTIITRRAAHAAAHRRDEGRFR